MTKERWVHLVTAPDPLTAEMWRDLLREQGIAAVVDPRDAVSFLGLSATPCRLMVPQSLLKEAEAILADLQ